MGSYISYLEEEKIEKTICDWIPDYPEYSDKIYNTPIKNLLVHAYVDLRMNCPGICDKKNINSSVAHAICYVYEYNIIKYDINNIFIPSKLFLYYNQRLIKKTQEYDSGASIRDGLRILDTIGICSEVDYPYNDNELYTKPSEEIYEASFKNKGIEYFKIIPTIVNIKSLLQDKIPIIFGYSVYINFENQVIEDNTIKLPKNTDKFIGGDCGVCVGFDDLKKLFIIMNCKGVEWGDKGYFYMPYSYVLNNNLCNNFWIIKEETNIL
jgi:C1A family cysteine protease